MTGMILYPITHNGSDPNSDLKKLKDCIKRQVSVTAKGTKREEIARWAILAQGPDCVGGLLHKDRKDLYINALTLRS
jgi:hypothetical protein